MSHPRHMKDMVLIAGPFADTPDEKSILGRMVALYLKAGTKFFIECREKLRSKEFYLWRDKAGYRSGTAGGRDEVAEGKRTAASRPAGKTRDGKPRIYAVGPVKVVNKPMGGRRSTTWTKEDAQS